MLMGVCAMTKYVVGDVVEGIVTGIESYGIFLSIDKVVSGLIHISEISDSYVRNISDYAKINDILRAKIIDIDPTGKRLKLTIKGLEDFNSSIKDFGIKENGRGFCGLAELLPNWISEKKAELEKAEILKKNINNVDKTNNN